MIKATILEAKTNLSELIQRAREGETVLITSGRGSQPAARLEAVEPLRKRRLGLLEKPEFVLPDSFFAPLPGGWTGEE